MNSLGDLEGRRRGLLFSIWGLLGLTVLAIGVFYIGSATPVEEDLRYRDPGDAVAREHPEPLVLHPVRGQTVYIPAYSHVYHQDGKPHLLTVTLSVRNTSFDKEITLTSVRYYNTQGKELRSHLKKPLRLGPLATTEFLIKRDDTSGGSGANFIVEWVAGTPVTEPIMETVMIDTSGQQGISFARSGTVISESVFQGSGQQLQQANP